MQSPEDILKDRLLPVLRRFLPTVTRDQIHLSQTTRDAEAEASFMAASVERGYSVSNIVTTLSIDDASYNFNRSLSSAFRSTGRQCHSSPNSVKIYASMTGISETLDAQALGDYIASTMSPPFMC